jgi:hypothetical protein
MPDAHRGAGGRGSLGRAAALLATGTALTLCVAAAAAWAASLNVRDEGRLRFVASSGAQLIDEGPASGTIPGRVRVRFTYNGNPVVTAQFTIYGRYGSISGVGRGRLSSPTSASPSFRGSLAIVSGSGRYARARGSGELFGVFYRRSFGLIVQAIGRLSY